MNCGMKSLDTSSEHFGCTSDRRNISVSVDDGRVNKLAVSELAAASSQSVEA